MLNRILLLLSSQPSNNINNSNINNIDNNCPFCSSMLNRPCSKEFSTWRSCINNQEELYNKWIYNNPIGSISADELKQAKLKYEPLKHCKGLFLTLQQCMIINKEKYEDIVQIPLNKSNNIINYEESAAEEEDAIKQRPLRGSLYEEEEELEEKSNK
jgi:hypothetical protein